MYTTTARLVSASAQHQVGNTCFNHRLLRTTPQQNMKRIWMLKVSTGWQYTISRTMTTITNAQQRAPHSLGPHNSMPSTNGFLTRQTHTRHTQRDKTFTNCKTVISTVPTKLKAPVNVPRKFKAAHRWRQKRIRIGLVLATTNREHCCFLFRPNLNAIYSAIVQFN